ncbi:phenazine biosynthesis protein PhzF [Malaciobacter molluscorum LMG 25693]|uniref:Epimerase, PhzC/PhzF family n=1 Tax=Malaciobacter molluscorum LMG 25693 TaxID=870501 RepID=A0A2G1DKV1_9BACT|nr:PhzF family phenazine biosynthesis protein [Malaciobacter molluscorum]AXX92700.1 epimerase, PhzC/PhzF family [Malaciobacter molluscorum LMG 25693]PHO19117.1 phenazine biosynthesis protein PhzF [Malaciobacter molluscorum LMG 25693]RXJ97431.1 phenazine biosynthesis protein PhzF [Malaciobacter molluscorum]
MKLKIDIVDAFTDELFKGNQAAVIILNEWIDESLMQNIAIENNLSETAFLVQDEHEVYHIRWFSPICEIDFCGHATLASSHILFNENKQLNNLTFFAKAIGEFEVKKVDDLIQMDFPNRKPEILNEIPTEIIEGLSITPIEVYKSSQAYFAIYENKDDVLNVTYKNEILKELAPFDVVVTSMDNSNKYDFISRYFWPANGGDEDPVTGSIHAGLAPLWKDKLNKNKFVALQASKRTGVLFCEVKENRVLISGKAISYLQGFIEI